MQEKAVTSGAKAILLRPSCFTVVSSLAFWAPDVETLPHHGLAASIQDTYWTIETAWHTAYKHFVNMGKGYLICYQS